jgi:hypothetical protein
VAKEPEDEPCAEILDRLRPGFEAMFTLWRIPPEVAREVIDEACRDLLAKRPRPQNPDLWLVRAVIRRCRPDPFAN